MSGACSPQAILEAQPDMSLEQVRERMAPYAARVAELQRRYQIRRGVLLQALWLIQEEFGWVPRIGIKWAAEVSEVSPVHAYGVAEFYTMYKKAPAGRYLIQVCETMCCQLEGADDLIAHVEQKLGIHAGETTADGIFTLLRVQCLAACGNAPAILINDEFLYGPAGEAGGAGERSPGESAAAGTPGGATAPPWAKGLNELEEGYHPTTADVDRWIERLRAEAQAHPEAEKIDQLGGIVLDTKGHPGVIGATGQPLPKDYAAAPPALKVKAESKGSAITISCLCAPETTAADLERSDDAGRSWRVIGSIDVTAAPGLPGPPGGPKTPSYTDELAIGSTASYRFIAKEGERVARPSAVAEVTATEPPPEPADAEKKGGQS